MEDTSESVYELSLLSRNTTYCKEYQPNNPYCMVYDGGRIIEIVFISVFILVGTFGNLLVILSIIYDKRASKHGNMFIINLAVADLIVSGLFLPTVLLNAVYTENILPELPCKIAGYVVTISCASSVCNLAFIALNRYVFIAYNRKYKTFFSREHVVLMVVFIWCWSNFIAFPTLFGPSDLIYDEKMAQCGWDDQVSVVYNVLFMICAIFFPVLVILFCYWRLAKYVKNTGKTFRIDPRASVEIERTYQQLARMQRDIALLKTLAATISAFLICWLPYGVIIMFFAHNVPAEAKKTAARLGLFNSAINFIIYGVINPVYRKGYWKFLSLFRCCKDYATNLPRTRLP